jgi:CBS domain-containing protein
MAKRRSGILVEEVGRSCIGILTPKDLLFRVVAQGLAAGTTTVASIMTPQPETMLPADSVLAALRQLQGSGRPPFNARRRRCRCASGAARSPPCCAPGYRNVPVVSSSGEAHGVLDILSLMRGALLTSSGRHERSSRRTESLASADGGGLESLHDSVSESASALGAADDFLSATPARPRCAARARRRRAHTRDARRLATASLLTCAHDNNMPTCMHLTCTCTCMLVTCAPCSCVLCPCPVRTAADDARVPV